MNFLQAELIHKTLFAHSMLAEHWFCGAGYYQGCKIPGVFVQKPTFHHQNSQGYHQ